MPRRTYDQQTVSATDSAYVRGLVIHEDAALLAFDKPAGLPVQTRNPDDRTLDALLAAFARSNGKRPRLVHRLDAQTSGVIVAAKTQPAAAFLSAAFASRDVSKTYLAVVTGQAFAADAGQLDTPLIRYRPRPGLELMRAARPGEADAQAAETDWRRLGSAGGLHLLELRPRTGRMHQLRAHLSLADWPILGDPYYGGPPSLAGDAPLRLMLHALALDLPHPVGGRLSLRAPISADFMSVLARAGLAGAADLAMGGASS